MKQHRPAARIAAIASIIFLSACHTITTTEVMRDVLAETRVGTPMHVASDALGKIGFRCGPNDQINFTRGDVLCARNGGSGTIVTGCIQRIFIDLDRRGRIDRIHDPSVSCAGF